MWRGPAAAVRESRTHDEDADERAERVDADVERCADAALDERLVDLVGDGVERGERDRQGRAAHRAVEERTENRVFREVGQLAQDGVHVPSSVERLGIEEKAKITAAQTSDGQPRGEHGAAGRDGRSGHRGMVGSPAHTERGEGTRCKSGTVPPL